MTTKQKPYVFHPFKENEFDEEFINSSEEVQVETINRVLNRDKQPRAPLSAIFGQNAIITKNDDGSISISYPE